MRSHEKPKFSYDFVLADQIQLIDSHSKVDDRRIPSRADDTLVIASWNLTNFGLHERESCHIEIMAHIIRYFDVVAVQEIADNLTQLDSLLSFLGDEWRYVFTDVAGNYERLGFLFRSDRVETSGLAAELAMRGYERARIEITGIDPEVDPFTGFNRNPYMISFSAGSFVFTLVNVHLYWTNMSLRRLEAKAIAKWAKSRIDKAGPPNDDIILIGDFNMPKMEAGDEIYDELSNYGLALPKHSTNLVGTNLAGDKHYDEIAFFPSQTTEDYRSEMGVFDFDNAVFRDLWQAPPEGDCRNFYKYVRYYIADHRPLWASFRTSRT